MSDWFFVFAGQSFSWYTILGPNSVFLKLWKSKASSQFCRMSWEWHWIQVHWGFSDVVLLSTTSQIQITLKDLKRGICPSPLTYSLYNGIVPVPVENYSRGGRVCRDSIASPKVLKRVCCIKIFHCKGIYTTMQQEWYSLEFTEPSVSI